MKVGILDSGIGGLTVLSLAASRMKNTEFIYYADLDNVPYGEKTVEEIKLYAENALSFLIDKGAKAVVFACNTATSVAIADMRKKYSLPIIGMEPALKRAADLYKKGRILVTATPVTIKGEKLHSLAQRIDVLSRADFVALPGLVHFAERGDFSSDAVKDYIRESFSPFEMEKFSSVVLGCTHFVYYKKLFKELYPSLSIVDGNEGTVNQLIRRIKDEIPHFIDDAEPSVEFFISGRKASLDEIKKYRDLINRCAEE